MIETLRPEQYRLGTRVVAVREDRWCSTAARRSRRMARSTRAVPPICRSSNCSTRPGSNGLSGPGSRMGSIGRCWSTRRSSRIWLGFIQAFPLGENRLRIAKLLVSERSQPDEAADARLDHYLTLRGWNGRGRGARGLSRPLPIGGDFAPSGGSAAPAWRSSGCAAASSIRPPAAPWPMPPATRCCSPSRPTITVRAPRSVRGGSAPAVEEARAAARRQRGDRGDRARSAARRRRAALPARSRHDPALPQRPARAARPPPNPESAAARLTGGRQARRPTIWIGWAILK